MDVSQLLYDWYLQKWQEDEQIAKPAREALNYAAAEIITSPISKSEFIRWLRTPSNNPRIKQDWIDGFTSGHESEAAQLPAAVQCFLRDCVNNPSPLLDYGDELRDAS